MSKPQLYLFVGYPGAGKTTVAQWLAEHTGAVHIWTDRERHAMFTVPVHSEDENRQLYAHLNDKTGHLLQEGKSVIFDTNFNFRKDRDYLRNLAARNGAETTIIWVTTPKELAQRRAVEESEGEATRLYGNMAIGDFERIASHLEAPGEDEKVLKIDGSEIDERQLPALLKL